MFFRLSEAFTRPTRKRFTPADADSATACVTLRPISKSMVFGELQARAHVARSSGSRRLFLRTNTLVKLSQHAMRCIGTQIRLSLLIALNNALWLLLSLQHITSAIPAPSLHSLTSPIDHPQHRPWRQLLHRIYHRLYQPSPSVPSPPRRRTPLSTHPRYPPRRLPVRARPPYGQDLRFLGLAYKTAGMGWGADARADIVDDSLPTGPGHCRSAGESRHP